MESSEDYVVHEIDKTKKKLRDIAIMMESQQQLLRLIVQVSKFNNFETFRRTMHIDFQKMEIKTEADDVDEGVPPSEMHCTGHSSKWTSPKIRKKLRSAISFNKGQHN